MDSPGKPHLQIYKERRNTEDFTLLACENSLAKQTEQLQLTTKVTLPLKNLSTIAKETKFKKFSSTVITNNTGDTIKMGNSMDITKLSSNNSTKDSSLINMDLLRVPTTGSNTNMNNLADCFLRGQKTARPVRKTSGAALSSSGLGFVSIPLEKNGRSSDDGEHDHVSPISRQSSMTITCGFDNRDGGFSVGGDSTFTAVHFKV